MTHRFIRRLIWSIVAAVVGYFLTIVFIGAEETLENLIRVPPTGLLFILFLSLLNYVLRFLRWHWYISSMDDRVPFGRHLLFYLAGLGLTTTPAKAGETIRSVYLSAYGVAYSNSIAALVVERFADMIAIALLSTLALTQTDGYLGWVTLALAAASGLIIVLRTERARERLQDWLNRLRIPGLRAATAAGGKMLHAAAGLLSGPLVAGGMLIGILAWGAEAVAFFFIAGYLGFEISVTMAMGIYSLSVLIGALSFIPGGLGSTEATMGLLLISAGAEPSVAISATVLCRVTTLWFGVAIGLGAIAALELTSNGLTASNNRLGEA